MNKNRVKKHFSTSPQGRKPAFFMLRRRFSDPSILPFVGKNMPSVPFPPPFVGPLIGCTKPSVPRPQRGFTIIELITVIVILAIILAFAIPSMRDLIQRNRLVSQTNDLITDLKLTRTNALTTGMPATICSSEDGVACNGDWNDGWIVFYDCDGDGTVDSGNVCPNINGLNQIPEQIIKVQSGVVTDTAVTDIQNSGTANKVRFDSVGLLLSPSNDHILRVCAEDLADGRRITVTAAGRTAITVWLSTEANPC